MPLLAIVVVTRLMAAGSVPPPAPSIAEAVIAACGEVVHPPLFERRATSHGPEVSDLAVEALSYFALRSGRWSACAEQFARGRCGPAPHAPDIDVYEGAVLSLAQQDEFAQRQMAWADCVVNGDEKSTQPRPSSAESFTWRQK